MIKTLTLLGWHISLTDESFENLVIHQKQLIEEISISYGNWHILESDQSG